MRRHFAVGKGYGRGLPQAREAELAGVIQAAKAAMQDAAASDESRAAGRAAYDAARNELVMSNMSLVCSIANRYAARETIPVEDLVQEGSLGAMHAAGLFRPTYRFSTYATVWIKRYIHRAFETTAGMIRVPKDMVNALNTWGRHSAYPPTSAGEVRAVVGCDRPTADRVLLAAAVLGVAGGLSSTYIPDRRTPDAPTLEFDEIEAIRSGVRRLRRSSRELLARRFGLGDGPEESRAEVGASMGISVERVRQLEDRALQQLKGEMVA